MRAERRGFALIELLVALSIGAVVLLGARTLLEALGGHAQATLRVARAADRDANSEHEFRRVVESLALAPDTLPSFEGDEHEARFASWCHSPDGWLEPCMVRIAVEGRGSLFDLTMTLSSGDRLVLRRGLTSARLSYLSSSEAGGVWYSRWAAGMSTPMGIGVLADSEMLVLRVGELR